MVETVTVSQEENNPSLEEQSQTQDASQEAQTNESIEETSERPEWLPEKFSNAQELAKAYSELEKKFSSKEPSDPSIMEARKQAEENQNNLKIKEPEQKTETQQNGLDKFYTEYEQSGSLSEQSYSELAKLGLDKNVVDAYISGQEALAEKHTASIMSAVGGQENYNNMIEWASQNLSKGEIDAFNNTVDRGTLEQAQLAIAGVNAKYQAQTREPNLFSGSKADSNLGYRSVAEMLTDINNPKYKTDTAFRKDVENKVKQSNVL